MATKPQDYKPKAGKFRIGNKEFKLRPDLENDWEFTEIVAAAEDGSAAAAVRMAKFVFDDNPDAYEALKTAARVGGELDVKKLVDLVESDDTYAKLRADASTDVEGDGHTIESVINTDKLAALVKKGATYADLRAAATVGGRVDSEKLSDIVREAIQSVAPNS